jgi:hypothetical protein
MERRRFEMFHIYTKKGATYTGFIYNNNNEKLDDVLTINKEIQNENRLVITGVDEVIISSGDIKFVEKVKEKTQQEDLPF